MKLCNKYCTKTVHGKRSWSCLNWGLLWQACYTFALPSSLSVDSWNIFTDKWRNKSWRHVRVYSSVIVIWVRLCTKCTHTLGVLNGLLSVPIPNRSPTPFIDCCSKLRSDVCNFLYFYLYHVYLFLVCFVLLFMHKVSHSQINLPSLYTSLERSRR